MFEHPWIQNDGITKNLLPDVPINMKEYNARRKLKKAGTAIIALNRLNKFF